MWAHRFLRQDPALLRRIEAALGKPMTDEGGAR
jgi:hypothetical protein